MVKMDWPPNNKKNSEEKDKPLTGGAKKNWNNPYKSPVEKEVDKNKQPADLPDFKDFKVNDDLSKKDENFEKNLEGLKDSLDNENKSPEEMDKDFESGLDPDEKEILNKLLDKNNFEEAFKDTDDEENENFNPSKSKEDSNTENLKIPVESIDNILKALDEREKNKIESAGRFKKAIIGTQKWWDEKLEWKIDPKTGEKKPNKIGKAAKVVMGAAFLGSATIGGAWLMGVPPSTLGVASRLGIRIGMATGINMAVTYGVFEKAGKKISGFINKFRKEDKPSSKIGKVLKVMNLENSLMLGGIGISLLISGPLVAGIVAGGIYGRKKLGGLLSEKAKKSEKELADLKKLFVEEVEKDGYTPADIYHNINGIGDNYDKMTEKLAKRIKRLKRAKTIINGAMTIGSGIATMTVLSAEVEHDKEVISNASKDAHGEQEEVTDAVKTIGAKGKAMEDAVENLQLKLESTSVEFEHGEGAIKTIESLKEKILENYGGDISKAPLSIQEIYNSNPTEEAIKLGFFNPSDPSGAESASIPEGSTLSFDRNGNLVFHNAENGTDQTLINGRGEMVDKYNDKFIDSDDSAGLREQRRVFEENLEKHGDSLEKIEDNIKNEDLLKNANDFEKATYGEENTENTYNEETPNEENRYSLNEDQQKEFDSLHKQSMNLLTENGKLEGIQYAMEAGDAGGLLNTPIEDLNENVHNLARYVSLLHEQTGLEPSDGESIQDYIYRAEIIAEKEGILNDISNQINKNIGEGYIENPESNQNLTMERPTEMTNFEETTTKNPEGATITTTTANNPLADLENPTQTINHLVDHVLGGGNNIDTFREELENIKGGELNEEEIRMMNRIASHRTDPGYVRNHMNGLVTAIMLNKETDIEIPVENETGRVPEEVEESEESTPENGTPENPYNLTEEELGEVEKINIKLFEKLKLTNINTAGTTETTNNFPAHLLLKLETGHDEANAIPTFIKGIASMTKELPFEPTPLNPTGETVPDYIKRISQLVYSKGMVLRASEYGTPLLSSK